MLIKIKANLPDKPGTLVQFIKPISDNAGNIQTIFHSREEKRGNKIPVMVQFDLPEDRIEEKLKIITKDLESQGIEILETSEVVHREIIHFILLGHVFETDFVDTYKRIAKTGAQVVRIEAFFTQAKEISNVKFEVHVGNQNIKYMMEEVRALCQEKNLTLISER